MAVTENDFFAGEIKNELLKQLVLDLRQRMELQKHRRETHHLDRDHPAYDPGDTVQRRGAYSSPSSSLVN
ncbi:hypothetical protein Bca4012_086693 [Brassica carinata]|uniref:(rape) hypothetical protein n=1 Tax=Brassica napus TaxID=3708 RepID=A0A816R8V6_BRANA|nr:unnamed protein product [Brassica napus]